MMQVIRFMSAVILCGVLAACAREAAGPRSPETVRATVNGVAIRQADVDSRVAELTRAAREMQPGVSERQLERVEERIAREALEQLIDKQLIEQAIAREGMQVSEGEVDARIRAMDEALRREGLSIEGLRDSMKATSETLRAQVRTMLRVEAFWDKRLGLKNPSEEELRRVYDKNQQFFTTPAAVHLCEVFVPYPEGRRPKLSERRALKTHAEALRARLLAGESFATVARDAAKGRAPAGRDGDLGWVTPQAPMPTGLLKAAFNQEVGKVGEVIESPEGYHVLLVQEKRGPQVVPFEQVKTRLAAELKRRAREEKIPGEMKKMRKEAKVEMSE